MAESKVDLILHPLRMRLIMTITGRQMTVQQLARALPDVAQATLYRHVKALLQGDILTVIDERPVRGTLEKIYALADLESLNLTEDDLANASKDDHMRYFTIFVTSLLGDFARYLQQSRTVNMAQDGVGYHTVPLYLSDDELHDLGKAINATFRPLLDNEPRPDRRRRLFSTVIIPSVDEPQIDDRDIE